jgi:hypothetical protein
MMAKIDALEALIATRVALALGHVRYPDRQLIVYLTGGPSSYGVGPESLEPLYCEIGVQYVAPNPFWQDATLQVVNFTTTPVALPQGTADARGVLDILASGAGVVNPTFLYKSGAGVTLATLNPTITIADGDLWRCDCITGQVRKRVSGVWSNAADTLPDHFLFPVFRRAHFTYGVDDPTGQVDQGQGSFSYRRQW